MKAKKKLPEKQCETCGQPISHARLEALPGVTDCVKCAEKKPPRKIDPNTLDLSEASKIDRTGFAPSD